MKPMSEVKKPGPPPLPKLALEMGPLVLFFLANSRPGLFQPLVAAMLGERLVSGANAPILTATAVFMVAIAISLGLTWALYRSLPVMPLVSGVVVLVFGALTLVFQDELFIKLKPTIVNCLFGAVLLGGLAFGKPLLPYVFDAVLHLDEAGWRKLTLRMGLFFFFLAGLNEAIWRTQTTDFWVGFKVWGMTPLFMAFMLAQTPLLMRHGFDPEAGKGEPGKDQR